VCCNAEPPPILKNPLPAFLRRRKYNVDKRRMKFFPPHLIMPVRVLFPAWLKLQ